jgi:hypothetical protein
VLGEVEDLSERIGIVVLQGECWLVKSENYPLVFARGQ